MIGNDIKILISIKGLQSKMQFEYKSCNIRLEDTDMEVDFEDYFYKIMIL